MLALGNFTALGFRLAVYMLASLLVGMCLREYVRSRAATSLGDPTPRLWGRLSWKPASWFDPFGSGVLPALIAILWTVQTLLIPAAYGKPAPVDPSRFRRHVRDVIIVSTAGPIATLALGIAAGLAVRVTGPSAETYRIMLTLCYTSMSLTVFHLLPIPGLDGARLVGLLLPAEPASVYRNLDKYLPLFVLIAIFVIAGPIQSIVFGLVRAMCTLASGYGCP